MSNDIGNGIGGELGNAAHAIRDEAASIGGTIREKGSEFGRKAASSIDNQRGHVADGLEGAARGLHERADAIAGGGERLGRATHGVADSVENASRYVRSKDAKEMLGDVEEMVRAHPTRSLLAVLAVGYLAGRALRRD